MKTSFSLVLNNQRRQPVGARPIPTILAREVIEHLQTLRFILSAVILTALMIVSGLATSASYRQVWKQYDANLNDQERGLRTLATLVEAVNFSFTATMPPDQWAFMTGAQQWDLPHQVVLTFLDRGEPTKVFTYPAQESASLLSWIQIVAFFVSFMAIILLFDAINGEGDTLKLIALNPVSRFQILAGKALAAYGVIGSSLLIAILCSVLVILAVGAIPLHLEAIYPIGLFFGLASIYALVFIFMSLAASASFKQPTTSLAFLLIVYLLVVAIWPSISGIMAKVVSPAPSPLTVQQQLESLQRDVATQYLPRGIRSEGAEKDGYLWERNLDQFICALSQRHQSLIDSVVERRVNQIRTMQRLAAISPSRLLAAAVEGSVGSDLNQHESFLRQAKNYQAAIQDYVGQMDARDSSSLHLLCAGAYYAATFGAASPLPLISNKKVEPPSIPRFRFAPSTSSERPREALYSAGVLLIELLLLMVLANRLFARADIR